MYNDENVPASKDDIRVDLMRRFVNLERDERETKAHAADLDAKSRDLRSALDECREELVRGLTSDEPKKAERGAF